MSDLRRDAVMDEQMRIGDVIPRAHQTEHDLLAATSEINRHHRDFARICDILDAYERGLYGPTEALKRIRNIVG